MSKTVFEKLSSSPVIHVRYYTSGGNWRGPGGDEQGWYEYEIEFADDNDSFEMRPKGRSDVHYRGSISEHYEGKGEFVIEHDHLDVDEIETFEAVLQIRELRDEEV
jgi:hypothetical protein